MEFELAQLSRQGGRDYNEDSSGNLREGDFLLCVVADGAGGHGGGDTASQTALRSILSDFHECPGLDSADLRRLIERANDRIVARQREGGRLAQMRSTIVVAAIDLAGQRMRWLHCGDSRAYLFRGGSIVARTADHSLVQQMVSGGLLNDEQARAHAQRSVLLSALGADDGSLEIGVSDLYRLEPGDAILLCSDGIWESLGDAGLSESLRAAGSPGQWLQTLDAHIAGNGKADQDNYTAVAAWMRTADSGQKTVLIPGGVHERR